MDDVTICNFRLENELVREIEQIRRSATGLVTPTRTDVVRSLLRSGIDQLKRKRERAVPA